MYNVECIMKKAPEGAFLYPIISTTSQSAKQEWVYGL